jgi:hypothetical protein
LEKEKWHRSSAGNWPAQLETGASFPFSPLPAHRPIPAITGDEVGQGVAGEEGWIKGD